MLQLLVSPVREAIMTLHLLLILQPPKSNEPSSGDFHGLVHTPKPCPRVYSLDPFVAATRRLEMTDCSVMLMIDGLTHPLGSISGSFGHVQHLQLYLYLKLLLSHFLSFSSFPSCSLWVSNSSSNSNFCKPPGVD